MKVSSKACRPQGACSATHRIDADTPVLGFTRNNNEIASRHASLAASINSFAMTTKNMSSRGRRPWRSCKVVGVGFKPAPTSTTIASFYPPCLCPVKTKRREHKLPPFVCILLCRFQPPRQGASSSTVPPQSPMVTV